MILKEIVFYLTRNRKYPKIILKAKKKKSKKDFLNRESMGGGNR